MEENADVWKGRLWKLAIEGMLEKAVDCIEVDTEELLKDVGEVFGGAVGDTIESEWGNGLDRLVCSKIE